MFLSHLLIDTGGNPDRPRPGRKWLRNVYHVHQRLCMAFPSNMRVQDDPEFLKPFKGEDFPLRGNANADPRNPRHSFLFRIDNGIESDAPRAIILVQSELKPNWDYAFHNARVFLAADPETREYNPAFTTGDTLRFRIRINLSKKIQSNREGIDLRKPRVGIDAKGRQKDQSKRVALTWNDDQKPEDVIVPWFAEKGAKRGFEVKGAALLQLGWSSGFTAEKEKGMKFRSALLEGTLAVANPVLFSQTLASGIGAAKAFGFGLLSVAPCNVNP
ncbi:MAG TPA: type I-E CRISPR-associated protein Cas6/Cse3/CasE [Candidatus Hydrogenedentes bacterium]|nr:type I-E CRISPR-associated protein Cas6/Cse3/CasE [Candidatus Hydrogenedentota bacterium]HOV74745.1 type I-E CRISPR-associated protein Cas6/Cse3/CasE [Candidatus Hydrogenedentota bacterium]